MFDSYSMEKDFMIHKLLRNSAWRMEIKLMWLLNKLEGERDAALRGIKSNDLQFVIAFNQMGVKWGYFYVLWSIF